ncbi:MAG: hypothetical protein GX259_03100 [Bacteroidales bacterium]|nr:hypothetical protein [Bacteroidales bacterium]
MDKNVKQYYFHINAAERFIMQESYLQASKEYKKAFSLKNTPFAIDQYNAAICEIFTENYKKTKQYVSEILQKGYSIDNLLKDSVFKVFFESKYGEKIIKNKPKIKIKDVEYRNILDSLFKEDQFYRLKVKNHIATTAEMRDSIEIGDVKVSQSLKKLIEKKGFPSEELIGISEYKFDPIYYVIMLHSFQRLSTTNNDTNRFSDFTYLIEKAVSNGQLYNAVGLRLLNNSRKYGGIIEDAKSNIIIIKIIDSNGFKSEYAYDHPEDTVNEWRYFDFEEKNIAKSDSLLNTFSMDSCHVLRKKIHFNEKGPFKLSVLNWREIFYVSDKELYNNLIKKSKPLKK